MISSIALDITADGQVVPAGHETSAFVLCGKDCYIPDDVAKKYGIFGTAIHKDIPDSAIVVPLPKAIAEVIAPNEIHEEIKDTVPPTIDPPSRISATTIIVNEPRSLVDKSKRAVLKKK